MSSKIYSDEFLIEEIKRFVSEFGFIPSPTHFDNLNGYPSRKTITNRFGNFRNALTIAGYKPEENEFNQLTNEQQVGILVITIKEYINKFRKTPTMVELIEFNPLYNREHYRRIFGGYGKFLEYLGLNDVGKDDKGKYTDKFLEDEFNRFVKENGRIPTIHEFNNSEYPSFWCYQSRFGSWNNAVLSYGYEPTDQNRKYLLDNGETCASSYEYTISTWFIENNIKYDRNIPYTSICDSYKGKMDCDYKLYISGQIVYVEMAGFLPSRHVEWNRFSPEEKTYARKLSYKKKLFKKSGVKYHIIYPVDIKTKSMEVIYEDILKSLN